MLLLALGDIHSNLGKVKDLKQKIKGLRIDLCLICGDFTEEGTLKVAERILAEFDFCKAFALPGNMDSKEIIQMLEEKKVSLHKKTADFGNYSFIGLGGGKPVNTFYRINVGELEAEKFLKQNYPKTEKQVILLSHSPAAGTRLEITKDEARLGLKALRKTIEEKQPLLLVHGHVHEAFGEEMIGKTLCVNTGAVKEGNAVLIELNGKPKIKRLRF